MAAFKQLNIHKSTNSLVNALLPRVSQCVFTQGVVLYFPKYVVIMYTAQYFLAINMQFQRPS